MIRRLPWLLFPAALLGGEQRPVDLQTVANQERAAPLVPGHGGNDLSEVEAGELTVKGRRFDIGPKYLALRNAADGGGPHELKGVKVGRKAAKLHFLHGTYYEPPEGAVAAAYVLRYEDASTAKLEARQGRQIANFWKGELRDPPDDAKPWWIGGNASQRGLMPKGSVALWSASYPNPHPGKTIAAIDFETPLPKSGAGDQPRPFCVAITTED